MYNSYNFEKFLLNLLKYVNHREDEIRDVQTYFLCMCKTNLNKNLLGTSITSKSLSLICTAHSYNPAHLIKISSITKVHNFNC